MSLDEKREFRFNERMTVRLKDANQLSKLLSTFRTMIKNDPRVLKTLHRRVFIEEVTPDGITLEFSFYVEAINKDQFLGIRSELWLSFVQALNKENSIGETRARADRSSLRLFVNG